ncbi:MAG: tRNA uracil 4-sulfurtransferase ThiI [Patescibacteria group bacterium]|nr:tRNA uracil 4-sulfurtransferase ThiI [Patescibacteria group bacterium]
MPKILVRYAEIALKGKNLSYFENRLIKNIKLSLNNKVIVEKQRKQFLITTPSNLINQSLKKLENIFGIAWFAQIHQTKSNLKDISKTAIKIVNKPKSFAIRASRSDKNLPFTSLDIAIKVGSDVAKASKAKVDLNNPETNLYISANKNQTYLYTNKLPGPGGLPVTTSGKVLSLLSGGFDSIISSYLMAKRGAQVDFLHFHVFEDEKKVLNSKIKKIINKLQTHTLSRNLFLSSCRPFRFQTLKQKNNLTKYEVVAFRRLMLKTGELLAKKHRYQALVLGDSLGQVASQTMENIVATTQAVEIPVFRPLIGMDKIEIINLVKKINLEKTTNLPYKDCCSLIADHPSTIANLEKIQTLEKNININKIINKTLQQTKTINL